MPVNAVGIPWYKDSSHYAEVKGIVPDSQGFHDTFGEWLTAAETVEREMKKQGFPVFRVLLTVPEFPDWCKAKGQPMSASSRSDYASEQAYRRIKVS